MFSDCHPQCLGDFNGDGKITVDELVAAVDHALYGCQANGQRFVDNGDGTITDHQTGLMWEKKDQSGGIHDYSNTYTWCGASCNGASIMDGTITTTFLASLNAGGGFAGHTDWRIPNVNELLSITNYQNVPAVDATFNTGCAPSCTSTTCSCIQFDIYWSSSPYQADEPSAWCVFFYDGEVGAPRTYRDFYVRAVRGGL
jgi:Protein of unknown function (DUF1566)